MPAPMDLTSLQAGLRNFEGLVVPFLVTVSSIGVASMAIVQTLKDQTPLRRFYQQFRVRAWIEDGVTSVNSKLQGQPASKPTVESDMLRLATDSDQKAFYALEIEKLCGQLNAAAQSAMQDVRSNQAFVAFLASETDMNCLQTVLGGPPMADGAPLPSTDPQMQAYAAARGQVAQQIQRAIDALQLSVGADWQTRMQQASLLLSVVISCLTVYYYTPLRNQTHHPYVLGIFTGVLAGYLAPVAKDLIAALQNLGE